MFLYVIFEKNKLIINFLAIYFCVSIIRMDKTQGQGQVQEKVKKPKCQKGYRRNKNGDCIPVKKNKSNTLSISSSKSKTKSSSTKSNKEPIKNNKTKITKEKTTGKTKKITPAQVNKIWNERKACIQNYRKKLAF